MPLTITVTGEGTDVRLHVTGEIDVLTGFEIRESINNLLSRSAPTRMVLDLWLVSFIDSTGIGALVACHQRAAVSGCALTIERASDHVKRQLWVSGLHGLFGLSPAAGSHTRSRYT